MAGGTYSTPGLTTFTATTGGEYSITAYGATGGGDYASGGKGAEVVGDFYVEAGERITIVVGGAGSSTRGGGYGGGGGTFVIETFNGTSSVHQKLIIAGGGGGAGYYAVAPGPNDVLDGGSGGLATAGGSGAGGQGSAVANYGGGGGGGYAGGAGAGVLVSTGYGATGHAGEETSTASGGTYTGGAGYSGHQSGSHGGYGGGGGGGYFGGGGGGGGYGGGTGGAGGANFTGSYGGTGGGSYDGGTNAVLTAGNSVTTSPSNGNGAVTITQIAPLCFLRGTNILTPTGQVLVETLRIGDSVVTRFNGIRPIKWIGRQTYAGDAVRSDLDKLPVCVHAGAIADGVPARNLYISPGHSMLVDGNLLIGSLMVNGLTVTQDWCPRIIDYYHLELDVHDCVIAEGAWSETYADAQVSRASFHNAAEFDALYPENGPAPDEFVLCAPRPERGSTLEQALRGVAARCAGHVKPGPLRGSVDLVEGAWRVRGWAHDLSHPYLPVLLAIELEGVVIGHVLACDERADLQQAGYGRGRCAFSFTSPQRLTPASLATLRVLRAADGEALPVHPTCSAAAERAPTVTRPSLRLVA